MVAKLQMVTITVESGRFRRAMNYNANKISKLCGLVGVVKRSFYFVYVRKMYHYFNLGA